MVAFGDSGSDGVWSCAQPCVLAGVVHGGLMSIQNGGSGFAGADAFSVKARGRSGRPETRGWCGSENGWEQERDSLANAMTCSMDKKQEGKSLEQSHASSS